MEHSNFVNNPVYLGSDSYAGIVNPIIAEHIINGNLYWSQVFGKLNINHKLKTQFFVIDLQATKQELSLMWTSKYTIY